MSFERSGSNTWVVCQLGAREHYAVPRALHRHGRLLALITDTWAASGSIARRFPSRGVRDRQHHDLRDAKVICFNSRFLFFEAWCRFRKYRPWKRIIQRNQLFQRLTLAKLNELELSPRHVLFSYSYTAKELFQYGKDNNLTCVLGQIDPGIEEERIVAKEHLRYPALGSKWEPAPEGYWKDWDCELALADEVIVNSEWSRNCLQHRDGLANKIRIIPLVYSLPKGQDNGRPHVGNATFRILFLGQINLRKGMGRLIEAMRILRDTPIQLILAGPSELSPDSWRDLPNVTWLGPLPRSMVGEAYRSANAFILPTLSDGFAITQLEALANGLPLLVSANCGKALTCPEDGIVMQSLEPTDIAAAILELRNRPRQIRQSHIRRFDLDDLARALCERITTS